MPQKVSEHRGRTNIMDTAFWDTTAEWHLFLGKYVFFVQKVQ